MKIVEKYVNNNSFEMKEQTIPKSNGIIVEIKWGTYANWMPIIHIYMTDQFSDLLQALQYKVAGLNYISTQNCGNISA